MTVWFNCARGSINNSDYLMKSALFNYPFQLSGSTARVYRIWSDNSPILATCLWVRLHQNFEHFQCQVCDGLIDWFILWGIRKVQALRDCNGGWEVTNSKCYLLVTVPSRSIPCEAHFMMFPTNQALMQKRTWATLQWMTFRKKKNDLTTERN